MLAVVAVMAAALRQRAPTGPVIRHPERRGAEQQHRHQRRKSEMSAPVPPAARRARVAFLAPSVDGTGNRTTSQRIAAGLQRRGWSLSCYSSQCESDVAALGRSCEQRQVDVLMGLHAFRAGQFLLPLQRQFQLPLLLVLGGTDVNEMVWPGAPTRPVVVDALAAAAAVVSFTRDMEARVVDLWAQEDEVGAKQRDDSCAQPASLQSQPLPSAPAARAHLTRHSRPRLCYIPQAVDLPPLPAPVSSPAAGACPCGQGGGCIRSTLRLPPEHRLFVLPCTLRAVKDPFFLAPAFERWYREKRNVHLVIVGSVVEEEYQPLADRYANAYLLPRDDDCDATAMAAAFSSCEEQHDCATSAQPFPAPLPPLAHYTGVSWLDSVSATTLLQSLRCASASVNSSRSEGQSGAILESMHLRVPVVARRIRGNESLVQHCRNGMLFDSPEECIAAMERVCAEWPPISLHAPAPSIAADPALWLCPVSAVGATHAPATDTTVPASALVGQPSRPPLAQPAAGPSSPPDIALSPRLSVAEMVANAATYTHCCHNMDSETDAYDALLQDIVAQAEQAHVSNTKQF